MNDTMNASPTTNDDPAAIEKDIRRTQDEMSRTVDKLGDQLSMKNLFNAVLEKADVNGVDSQYLLDGARRNPIALGLIAAGAIWLVSDKSSKFPSISSDKSSERDPDPFNNSGLDVHHRDYVSHMSSLEIRDGEDAAAFQRRRDLHRANFLMCERRPEEDEHSFRERLDNLTDKFREKRSAWSASISQVGSSATQSAQQSFSVAQRTARQATGRAQDVYDGNPLVVGILAAAIGAGIGSAVPLSRKEQETLGEVGADARDMFAQQKDELASKAMEKKDELLEKADQTLQASGAQQEQGQTKGQGSTEPFIIAEPTR